MEESLISNKIAQSIAEIAAVASKLPGVIIIHDLRDSRVAWMSENGLQALGVSLEEIKSISAEEYYARYFNSEDAKDYVPKLTELLKRNIADHSFTFFQQVHFKEGDDWNWHMASTRILTHDNDGLPLLIITMAFPIDAMHHMTAKAVRLLEENNFLRKNFHKYSALSNREQEILKMLSLGKSSAETAEQLFISLHTVETHRKNIRHKLDTNSYFELCQYARAFDLI